MVGRIIHCSDLILRVNDSQLQVNKKERHLEKHAIGLVLRKLGISQNGLSKAPTSDRSSQILVNLETSLILIRRLLSSV